MDMVGLNGKRLNFLGKTISVSKFYGNKIDRKKYSENI